MTILTFNSAQELEAISKLSFKKTDVLDSQRDKIKRHASLLKAVVMDSLHKAEVVLIVEDQDSTKKLRSRIIAAGNDRVMLDKGISIPVHCISHVEFPG